MDETVIDPLTGMKDGDSLYVFSTVYDYEKECVGFIFQNEHEIAFATNREEAVEKLADMQHQLGEKVIVWKLVPERLDN